MYVSHVHLLIHMIWGGCSKNHIYRVISLGRGNPIYRNVCPKPANTPPILPSTTEMMLSGNIISGTPVRQDGNKLPSCTLHIHVPSKLGTYAQITVILLVNNCYLGWNHCYYMWFHCITDCIYASIMLPYFICVHIRMCTMDYIHGTSTCLYAFSLWREMHTPYLSP